MLRANGSVSPTDRCIIYCLTVCPIPVAYMELDRLSSQLMSIRTYLHVRVCVRMCTHWIASKSVHLARHVYWPAGLVANCQQQDWRATWSSHIRILHRTIKFSTVYCNGIGHTQWSSEHIAYLVHESLPYRKVCQLTSKWWYCVTSSSNTDHIQHDKKHYSKNLKACSNASYTTCFKFCLKCYK